MAQNGAGPRPANSSTRIPASGPCAAGSASCVLSDLVSPSICSPKHRRFILLDHADHAADSTAAIACSRMTRLRIRSEEHTSELQSLMRISYAVFCLTKKNKQKYTIAPQSIIL